jgi:hypothetical protein
VTYESGLLVYRGVGDADNWLSVYPDAVTPGWLTFQESLGAVDYPGTCTEPLAGYVNCPGADGIKVELGAGNDDLNLTDPEVPLNASLGDGDDSYSGDVFSPGTSTTSVNGDAGSDRLAGGAAGETLNGGLGNDAIYGNGGADRVLGGLGNDLVCGDNDEKRADLIDGGPGFDRIDSLDWGNPILDNIRVTVSLDGLANDGRLNERDNVRSVEKIHVSNGGTFMGALTARDDTFITGVSASTITGRGGNDRLKGGDSRETINGGAGHDMVIGGRGHDLLIGGGGRDTIFGDNDIVTCGPLACNPQFGSDTIRARDGARDVIYCGVGNDTAIVDRLDRVSRCETVRRP